MLTLGYLGPATKIPDWGTGPAYDKWPDAEKERALFWQGDIVRYHQGVWPQLQTEFKRQQRWLIALTTIAAAGVLVDLTNLLRRKR